MTRRDWFAAAGLTLAACGSKRAGGYPGAALVAVSGETSLAVVDLLGFRLRDPIPLGAAPTSLTPVTAHGGSYALTPASGSVHLIEAKAGGKLERTASRKLADELSEIHVGPGGELFCLSAQSREIVVADPRNLSPVRRMKLAGQASGMDVSVADDTAVALASPNTVTLFSRDGKDRTVAIDGAPEQVRFRADGKLLIVTRPADRVLTVLSVPELHVLAHLPLAMEPRNLCFTPDGGQLFVTGPGMDGLAIVFPYNTLEVEQTILAGRSPGCMACAGSPEYLFVASATASAVSVLSVPTRKLIALVEVGLRPRFIALTPDNQYALILDEGSGDMAVVRIPLITVNRGKSGAALFTLLPVGAKPVHAAVVPYRGAV